MIHLFKPNTPKLRVINQNGDFILDKICTSSVITQETSDFYYDATFRILNTLKRDIYDNIVEEAIIKVNDEEGDEYFAIDKVIKNKTTIEIFARHITIFETLTLWLEDVRPENQYGNGAINWIFDNSIGENNLEVSSDIDTVNTAYYVNKRVYEALETADNSFLERWGGEVYRKGYKLAINKTVGNNKGVVIRSRKNLIGFEVTENKNELVTRAYIKGFDGITPFEKYVDSQFIEKYSRIYTKEYTFEDVKVKDETNEEGFDTLEEAQAELLKRGKQLFEVEKVDIINTSYRINFVQLEKTEEYKNYKTVTTTSIRS